MKALEASPQQLYAFWKYDHFPYYLGGEVSQVLDSGRVRVKGYDGMTFDPVRLVPATAGRPILERLNNLRREHDKAEKAFKAEWRERVEALLP